MFARLIQPSLWGMSEALLRALGLELSGARDSGSAVYLRLGRWLVRSDQLLRSLATGRVRKRDLLRARRYWVTATDGRLAPELIMVRQRHRPKVSVFRLAARSKEVATAHAFDFDNEMEADHAFRSAGLPCPDLLSQDRSFLRYSQRLVVNPLIRNRPVDAATVDAMLHDVGARMPFESWTADRYLEEARAGLATIAISLSADSVEKLKRPIAALARILVRSSIMRLPVGLCHGDFSSGNLLRSDGGTIIVNDFDRALTGTAFYDATYLATIDGRSRDWLLRKVWSIDTRHGVGLPQGDAERLSVVTALLVTDLVRYSARRFRSIEIEDDRLCAYSVELALRASASGDWGGVTV